MRDFLNISPNYFLFEDDFFFVIKDRYPVSPGHSLIISKRIVTDFFELTSNEQERLIQAINKTKELIENDFNPDGYNIGMNCGAAAGQTVFHFHCHIIPRYKGDVENPRGGVRNVILGKGDY
jgi:diadenosine tetraphosphate (Ap4A) HIT family hydrolase